MKMEKQGEVSREPAREASVNGSNIHYTQLPDSMPGDVYSQEWNVYRREVGRWLAEGQQGRHVLIKGLEIIGIFDTWDEAQTAGLRRNSSEPFFIHEIREEEPYLRVRGVNFPWPNRLIR